MAEIQTANAVASRPRPWFLLGSLLFATGIVIYVVQFSLKQFVTPWYTPILGTAGLVFMAVSVWQRKGILRLIGFVLLGLFCGLQWYFVGFETKVPPYAGPARTGQELPAFSARLAGGMPFTNKDLGKETPTVLVFYRGHW
jgi:hypothetical protein